MHSHGHAPNIIVAHDYSRAPPAIEKEYVGTNASNRLTVINNVILKIERFVRTNRIGKPGSSPWFPTSPQVAPFSAMTQTFVPEQSK